MEEKTIYKTETKPFREKWISFIHEVQDNLCKRLEDEDGKAKFIEDNWERNPEGKGGGGRTRVISNGNFIEKGGVNSSVVFGKVTDAMKKQLKVEGHSWFACGVSIVLHPLNPYTPTIHANWRYFELYDEEGQVSDRWFGGGSDLTPNYLFEEDAIHFHETVKNAIDPFGASLYAEYKKNCDAYFCNSHRNHETRGIGGVFYDYLRPTGEEELTRLFEFQRANASAFLPSYLPIVQRRKTSSYGEREKEWQEIRRGRYVEFNLIHDRGTLFGLKTNGRTESILMSLPPRARWYYNYQPAPGSEEEKLLQVCLNPKDWI